jgi:O-palmitoleoyl-L-serine hydrolase
MARRVASAALLAAAAAADTFVFEPYGSSTNAICNDGSPSGLYFTPGDAAQKDIWVVQLQGGGWCWDAATCAARTGDLTSSKGWKPSMVPAKGSILAADGTDWASANRAYQAYCTSDGYVGDGSAGGMHFRGHAVVLAMLDALRAKGMGASGNSTLLFSGCSAGGRGVMHNLNRAAALAKSYGVARFVALIDSGLYIDLDPLPESAVPPLRVQAQGVVSYLHASVDPACAAAFPATEAWKCLIGEYAVPTLAAPFVLNAFQADRWQLGQTAFGSYVGKTKLEIRANAAESSYAETWRARTRTALAAAAAAQGTEVALHSADCYTHCNTETGGFSNQQTVAGVSLKQVVQSFVFGTDGPTQMLDNCTGTFACGAGCSLPGLR